jgi:hypothetical protein
VEPVRLCQRGSAIQERSVALRLNEIRERGFRAWLNENPKIATTTAGVVIGIALLYIVVYVLRNTGRQSLDSYSPGEVKAWYATEDGNDLYADDAALVPPFQKNGKTFYRAYVYKCPNGEQWVNHIEMFPPDVKQKMDQIREKSDAPLLEYKPFRTQSLIKRPGGKQWYAYNAKDSSNRHAAMIPKGKSCSGEQAVAVDPPK